MLLYCVRVCQHTDSTNVLINGLALTDPRFFKYPMLLSLLKFHSPSTNSEDSTASVPVRMVELSDSRDKETEV